MTLTIILQLILILILITLLILMIRCVRKDKSLTITNIIEEFSILFRIKSKK